MSSGPSLREPYIDLRLTLDCPQRDVIHEDWRLVMVGSVDALAGTATLLSVTPGATLALHGAGCAVWMSQWAVLEEQVPWFPTSLLLLPLDLPPHSCSSHWTSHLIVAPPTAHPISLLLLPLDSPPNSCSSHCHKTKPELGCRDLIMGSLAHSLLDVQIPPYLSIFGRKVKEEKDVGLGVFSGCSLWSEKIMR